MGRAPAGQSKSPEENTDPVVNAAKASTPNTKGDSAKNLQQPENPTEQQAKNAEANADPFADKVDDLKNPAQPDEHKGAAPADDEGSIQGKRAATVTASPESVSKPGDEQQPAQADASTPSGAARADNDPAKEGPAQFDVAPAIPGPNDPIAEGIVQVTRKAREGEPHDPSGNITQTAEAAAEVLTPANDVLGEIDSHKLPVSVTVGSIIMTIEEYAGRPVFSLSLVGWVGDAPFKILANQVGPELEKGLAELRAALA